MLYIFNIEFFFLGSLNCRKCKARENYNEIAQTVHEYSIVCYALP